MITFLYRCPATGYTIQGGLRAQDVRGQTYVAQTCLACGSIHLVNPASGRLLSEETARPADSRPAPRATGRRSGPGVSRPRPP